VQEQWLGGGLTLDTEKELKGRLLALGEVVDLSFGDIAKFYEQTDARNAITHDDNEDDEGDGSEAPEDDAG
jgi:hypothetical protein